MPSYEASFILRTMTRPEIKATLKRVAETIFAQGAVIRKLENLGSRELPFKMSRHGVVHKTGSYFMFEFDCPPSAITELNNYYLRDIDVVRASFSAKTVYKPVKCTLDEELLPPAYRKDVQTMLQAPRRKLTQQTVRVECHPF